MLRAVGAVRAARVVRAVGVLIRPVGLPVALGPALLRPGSALLRLGPVEVAGGEAAGTDFPAGAGGAAVPSDDCRAADALDLSPVTARGSA